MTKCRHERLLVRWGDSSTWISRDSTVLLENGIYHTIRTENWEQREGGEPEEFLCEVLCDDCDKVLVESGIDYPDTLLEERIIERIRGMGAHDD